MKIRKFRDSDAAAVARMHRATIRKINIRDYTKSQIGKWSARTSAKNLRDSMKFSIRFVALEKGRIVGFGDFTKEGEINSFYVHNRCIGKGIGKNLLRKMEKIALSKGIKKFTLMSTITAKEFYKSQGYKVIRKTILKRPGLNRQVYKMEKLLRHIN